MKSALLEKELQLIVNFESVAFKDNILQVIALEKMKYNYMYNTCTCIVT